MKLSATSIALLMAMLSQNTRADSLILGTVQYKNDKPQIEQIEDTRACNQEVMKESDSSSSSNTAGIVGGILGGAIGRAIRPQQIGY